MSQNPYQSPTHIEKETITGGSVAMWIYRICLIISIAHSTLRQAEVLSFVKNRLVYDVSWASVAGIGFYCSIYLYSRTRSRWILASLAAKLIYDVFTLSFIMQLHSFFPRYGMYSFVAILWVPFMLFDFPQTNPVRKWTLRFLALTSLLGAVYGMIALFYPAVTIQTGRVVDNIDYMLSIADTIWFTTFDFRMYRIQEKS